MAFRVGCAGPARPAVGPGRAGRRRRGRAGSGCGDTPSGSCRAGSRPGLRDTRCVSRGTRTGSAPAARSPTFTRGNELAVCWSVSGYRRAARETGGARRTGATGLLGKAVVGVAERHTGRHHAQLCAGVTRGTCRLAGRTHAVQRDWGCTGRHGATRAATAPAGSVRWQEASSPPYDVGWSCLSYTAARGAVPGESGVDYARLRTTIVSGSKTRSRGPLSSSVGCPLRTQYS